MGKLRTILCFISFVILIAGSTAVSAQDRKYAIRGTIVTPDDLIEKGTVLVSGSKIEAVGSEVKIPNDATILDVDGIILPGFVDLHNHLTWNALRTWKPNKEFANRYEWQQTPEYNIALATPHAQLMKQGLGCDLNRFAEVKAISEGETSVVGSLSPPQECIEGLARNLDFSSGFTSPQRLGDENLRYEVFPLELDNSAVAEINDSLDKKAVTTLLVHLAEGKPTDASAAREFNMFVARGFLRAGVSVIHGTALKREQFQQMAEKQVGLIWSPRSNLELYGATTDVLSAQLENVKLALSPDWSPTGSNGMLEEMKFAAVWNARQNPPIFSSKDLVLMATKYPAQLAHLSDKIGTLAPHHYADLIVVRRKLNNAYDSIVHANPDDVDLVIIGGEPVYGDPDILKKLLHQEHLETITPCQRLKAISFATVPSSDDGTHNLWKRTTDILGVALESWGNHLAPLANCAF